MLTPWGAIIYATLTAFGVLSPHCHDRAPKIISESPTPNQNSACDIIIPKVDVIYGVWASVTVFDFGKSFVLF